MAENPISSDSLTINFADLMSIPVADRAMLAQQSPYFAAQLTTSLTPIELAKAFPDYYRRELPDISNFITSTIQGKLSKAGRGYDQTGGGAEGQTPSYYQGEVTPTGAPTSQKGRTSTGAATTTTTGAAPPKPVPPSVVDRVMKEAGLSETSATVKQEDRSNIKPRTPQEYFGSNVDVSALPAGMRNNNPGNILYEPSINWDGSIGPSTNKDVGKFQVVFDSPEMGMRAAAKLAMNKYNKHGLNTIRKLILAERGWTPNASEAQAANVAKAAGFSLDEQLNLNDPEVLKKVLRGIITQEHGQSSKLYTDDLIDTGINLAIPKDNLKVEQEAAAAVEDIKGPAALAVTPDLQQIIDSDPEMKKKFGENTRLAGELQKAVDSGKITLDKMKTIITEAKSSAEAAQKITNAAGTAVTVKGDPSEQWGFEANRTGEGVDPRLMEVLQAAAEKFPLRVRMFSGQKDRNKGAHAEGKAADVAIYDEAGNVLSSYQDPQTMNFYGMYWQTVYDTAKELHGEEFAKRLSWLGADVRASGQGISPLGAGRQQAYGAGDQMDIRLDASFQANEAFKVGEGWNAAYGETYTEGDFLGIGARQGRYTDEDFAKMVGFRLSKDQIAAMEKRASDINSKSGYFNRVKNIGERETPLVVQEQPRSDIVPPKQLESKPTDDIPAPTAQQAPDIVPPETDKKPEELVSPVQGQSTPEPPAFRTGGSPDVQDDEDLTAVGSDGKPAFKFNSGEGLYVKPEADEYADDKIEELSDKINKIDEMYQKNAGAENTRKPSLPDKLQPEQDSTWRKRVASASVSPGSQSRAFRRSKFRDEGFHWGRGSPNSITN